MLARRDIHRNLVLAHQVIGHADVVKSIDLDHHVVDAALSEPRDSERDGMIAFVAMHEDEFDGPLAAAEFVLDAAAHPELSVEALGRIDVALAHDAMTQAAGAGLEPPMHRTAGMERLA